MAVKKLLKPRKKEEKVRKNREKREKAKARKSKKGKGGGAGMEVDGEESAGNGDVAVKKRLGPAKIAVAPTDGNDGAAGGAGEEQVASVEEAGITIHEDD